MALYRHDSEQALKEDKGRLGLYSRRLEILHRIDQAILAADSLEAIAQAALRLVEQLVPCRQSCVVTLDCGTNEATFLAICDGGEAKAVGRPFSLPPESGYCQELSTGDIQIVDHDRLARHLAANGVWWAEPMPFYVSVPLLSQDTLLGALDLGIEEPEALSQEQLAIVREVANSLAVAIRQAQLRERVERHAAELEARNAELNAFAHTVAHDIQDPLGLLVGFADVLAQDWAEVSPEELQEYLQIISRTARKVSNIVYELILLAETRSQDVTVYPLDMGKIVNQARSRLVHLIEEYGAEISVPDTWPVAVGHDPWVEEVWVNYLSNAIKYGSRPPCVDLGATVVGDQVRFWVRDNGPGVPPEAQARLFVPFTRLSQARTKGYGLGLSIVQCIIEKLGGQVGVESEGVPGEGTIFSFTLPAAQG